MSETKIHIMRFVLVLLLFQFIAPGLIPVSAQATRSNRDIYIYDQQHHSLVMPVLLKEKEETESRDDAFADVAPLIDFSDHRYVLAEFHTAKLTPFVYRQRYNLQPPLFMLHGAFLI